MRKLLSAVLIAFLMIAGAARADTASNSAYARERAWLLAGPSGAVVMKHAGYAIDGSGYSIAVPVVQGSKPQWRITQVAGSGGSAYYEVDCRLRRYRRISVVYDFVAPYILWTEPGRLEVGWDLIRKICSAPLFHEHHN